MSLNDHIGERKRRMQFRWILVITIAMVTIASLQTKDVCHGRDGFHVPFTVDSSSHVGQVSVTCLASPDNCFDVVNGILAGAQESIYISVYTLSSGYLLDTIHERMSSGVDVRLLLEYWQVSHYERSYNRYAMNNLTVLGTAQGLWASLGFDFQHCKYAIIDNETLIISSGNWARSSCPKPQDDGDVDGNRDWWFVVHGNATSTGQAVVDDFLELFEDDWDLGFEFNETEDGLGFAQSYDRHGSPSFKPFIRSLMTVQQQMTIERVLSPDDSQSKIISLIESANQSLLIEQMYIYDDLTAILNAIIAARARGVNCCVIQGHGISEEENNASAEILEASGVKVRRCKSNSSIGLPFDTQHNKGVIVDGKFVLVSSINWSPTSINDNREAGLIIGSTTVAGYYTDLFNHDWERSVPFNGTNGGGPIPEVPGYHLPIMIISIAGTALILIIPWNERKHGKAGSIPRGNLGR
ncbi:hypothetical protein GF325_15300 [Candidatus Bathyarchaeota archaeon]|nr:hypothetical protein [Candidatus Bathyarchaeota archaeon]